MDRDAVRPVVSYDRPCRKSIGSSKSLRPYIYQHVYAVWLMILSAFRERHPHLYPAIACPGFQARLWMHCRPVKHAAILQGKPRGVIWALNTVTDQLAF